MSSLKLTQYNRDLSRIVRLVCSMEDIGNNDRIGFGKRSRETQVVTLAAYAQHAQGLIEGGMHYFLLQEIICLNQYSTLEYADENFSDPEDEIVWFDHYDKLALSRLVADYNIEAELASIRSDWAYDGGWETEEDWLKLPFLSANDWKANGHDFVPQNQNDLNRIVASGSAMTQTEAYSLLRVLFVNQYDYKNADETIPALMGLSPSEETIRNYPSALQYITDFIYMETPEKTAAKVIERFFIWIRGLPDLCTPGTKTFDVGRFHHFLYGPNGSFASKAYQMSSDSSCT